MKLAGRIYRLGSEGAFTVLAKATALERKGRSIIHFEIGQPDFNTFSNIRNAGIKAIKSGKTRYVASLGTHELRGEIAQFASKEREIKILPENVAVTPGCKNALFAAFAAIVEEGNEVIYPDPSFPAYKNLIEFFGGKAIPIPLLEEREFSFDMKEFKKKVSKKTKAIIINSPGNPTGTIIPKRDLEQIAKIAKKFNIWVITDEIYSRIIYDAKHYDSIYTMNGMRQRTIMVDGFSKTYAMTGWRLGYLIMPKEMGSLVDNFLNNSISCTAAFTQEAGLEALRGPQREVKNMVSEFKKRRDFVVKELNKIPGVSCFPPNGAFYAFPNIKSFQRSSKKIADYLLEDGGVAVLDGTSFGALGEGYLRISYATSMGNLEEGLRRIKRSLQKLPMN